MGCSDILYHFTKTINLVNILKNNYFNLTIALGSRGDFNINKKRFFFFSTTRSKSVGFVKGNVKIVLDGFKLKQNYKITPVNYWNSPFKQHTEQEDRIVSNKSTIQNAINYIFELHILQDNSNVKYLHLIDNYCKQNNIIVNYYGDRKNWLNQTNQIELPDLNDTNIDNEYSCVSRFDFRLAALISYNNEDDYNKIVNYLNNTNDIKKLNQQLKDDTYNYLKIGAQYDYETQKIFKNTIYNIRTNTDVHSKFLIDLLVMNMIKNKINTLSDYITKKNNG